MNLVTGFLHHPILNGLLVVAGLGASLFVVGFVMQSSHWVVGKLRTSRYPRFGGFIKRKLMD